jgi:hypothetical protein
MCYFLDISLKYLSYFNTGHPWNKGKLDVILRNGLRLKFEELFADLCFDVNCMQLHSSPCVFLPSHMFSPGIVIMLQTSVV